MKRLYYLAALGALVLLSLTVLAAQPARAEEEQEATPGVARISLIHGDVSTLRGDSGDEVATSINAPLVRGDKIITGEKSQAEIQLDHSNILRLAPRTEVRIADLTRTQIQIQVAQGLANYTVLKSNEAEIEIDTPNMAVRPVKEGSYRIEVKSPTETQLIVRKGDADVTTPKGTARVEEGRVIVVRGSEDPEYQIAKAPNRDEWDKWNKSRDNDINDAKSYRYANRYYTGAHDLDRNGRWAYVSEYDDWCWTPYVNAGWAPYRDGNWGWAPYWGWTWTSYEPWGWAPYHYGRWFSSHDSWYWWPGSRYHGYYPTWGPAYVSFLGFGFGGHNWGFGFGYGYNSIGWCPLGPYDNYYPWWGGHNSYNVVNITNITNINNVNYGGRGGDGFGRGRGRGNYTSNLQAALTNAHVRGGISRASTEDFVRGRIPRQQTALNGRALREGQLVQGRIPAAPTRETLRPINRPVNNVATTGRGSGTENFFSRRQPPTVARSFNEQAASVQQMMQRHNPMQTADRGGTPGSTTGIGRPSTGANSAHAGGRPNELAGRNAGPGFGTAGRATAPAGTPDATTNRGREGFGANAGTSPDRGFGTTGATNRPTSQGGNPTGGPNVEVRGGEQTGWQRFGQTGSRGVEGSGTATRSLPTRQELAQRNARPTGAPAQPPQPAPQQNTNSRRFGTGQARAVPDRPTTTGGPAQGGQTAPQSAPGRTNGERFGNSQGTTRQGPSGRGSSETARPAPQGTPSGGFRSFGERDRAESTEREGGVARPMNTRGEGGDANRQRNESSDAPSSGWGRFGSRSDATTNADRPALGIRKSITTERAAPRSFAGGGQSGGGGRSFERSAPSTPSRSFEGGGRAAPSSSPRSFEGGSSGGGNRGWSAPSGSGRSAPSAPSRTFEGGGGGRSTGGNRGWSAPSGGGGMRSAPSAPSRSYGGGGSRGSSAPSGGGRGASAPSGGGRGSSAPSGGGRSAPAPSRGGGQQGRR